ncbi:MAG: lamin tail domain-containing protein, partial [bacterium]
MLKKPFLFFLLFALLLPWSFAYASLEINEIMYDLKTGSDEGREWVEIYNNGDVAVDVSKFRFFEGDTNHKIKLVQGDPSLVPKGYSVIAVDPVKFKLDFSNFAGNLFDSSFSLS